MSSVPFLETSAQGNKKKITRDHDELIFFVLCFSGRVVGVLLQFDSIIFKVFSNLINSITHFTWNRSFFCMWIWTNEFWKGLKVGLFIFALKVSQETRLLTSTDFKRLIIEFMQNLLNFWTVRLEQVVLLYNKALLS